MKRDMSVTVTRDSRVTSQVPRHRDSRDMSRVSHATTTTPHHTMYLPDVLGGVSINESIHRLGSSERTARAEWMSAPHMFGGGC